MRDTLTGCLERQTEPMERIEREETDEDERYQKRRDEQYEREFI